MKVRGVSLAIGLVLGAAITFGAYNAHAFLPKTGETAAWVKEMKFSEYEPQRVIYHVDEGAGLFSGRFRHILQVAQNHVDAVGADRLDLRIVMQSEGVDMLAWAKKDAEAQAKIDRLKKQGVKFEICRNTLVARRINPDTDLYDVKRDDIIRAAVGEVAALEGKGFRYIKP